MLKYCIFQGYKEYSTTLTHSGLTDLFLVVSGYLTFDFGIKAVSTGGAFALVLSILLRWIRYFSSILLQHYRRILYLNCYCPKIYIGKSFLRD